MSSFSGPFNEGVLTQGLVLSYDADELASYPGSGSTVTDLSSSNKTGSFVGASSGFNSNSVIFDGSGDYLTVPSSTTWNCSGDFTIEAWVYQSNVSTQYIPFMVSAVNNGFWFGRLSTGYGLRGYNVADYIQSATTPIANTWYHVAVSRQSTTLRLFINGKLESSVTNSITFGSAAAYIGSDGGSQYFNGNISNFRIVNGTALYTKDFTPPSQHLQPVTGTALLTCQTAFIDGSTNKHTITANGNAALSTDSPFNKKYSTFKFNGTNAYIESAAPLPAGQQKYTISAWFKTTTTGQVQSVWEQANGAGNGRGALLIIGTAWGFNGQGNDAHDKVPVRVNRWTHGVVVVDTTNTTYPIKLYENGVLYWQGQPSGGGAALNLGATVAEVGKKATVNTEYFSGDIASVAVYNRNLSGAEISQLYDANCEKYGLLPAQSTPTLVESGLICQLDASNESSYPKAGASWTDIKAQGNATLINGPTYDTDGGGSIVFDGVNDYATIPYNSIFNFQSNPFTICVWHKNTSTSTSFNGIITADSTTDNTWKIYRDNGNNYYRARSGSTFCDFAPYTVGKWHYYVYTKSGTTLITYLDGVQNNTITNAQNTVSFSNPIALGSYRYNDAVGLFYLTPQKFGAIQIYNRALSAAEIQQNFEAQRTRFRV